MREPMPGLASLVDHLHTVRSSPPNLDEQQVSPRHPLESPRGALSLVEKQTDAIRSGQKQKRTSTGSPRLPTAQSALNDLKGQLVHLLSLFTRASHRHMPRPLTGASTPNWLACHEP